MAVKRRSSEIFSISFLDCICCGFGAMLLLFVLTIGRHSDAQSSIISELQRIISQLDRRAQVEEQVTGEIRNTLQIREERISTETSNLVVSRKNLTELQQELALLLLQQSNLKDELDRLIAAKAAMPRVEDRPPIPIPNVQRRQYLTGFNFEGQRILILVEASGGMVANTIDEAIASASLSDEEKRRSIKWRRVVRSVQWIIANLAERQRYQVVLFNHQAFTLLDDEDGEWLDPYDRDTLALVLRALEDYTPRGGANLELAFIKLKATYAQTDSIMLLTDGLPTQSSSVPVGTVTDDRDRERFFRVALREMPRRTPVNTILFPMTGDPAAAFLFWQMAEISKGALVSPSPNWPDL